jgi:tRNA threonylcarbamoyladenosine biosynthesis protein TsaE
MIDLTRTTLNHAETRALGQRIGSTLRGGEIICLVGPLGAGKTALAAGIAQGWGAAEPATSPTFVIVHQHSRPSDNKRLFHLDCYRLAAATEADTIGLDDMLNEDDVLLIEWPDRLGQRLPKHTLQIDFTLDDDDPDRRLLRFRPAGLHTLAEIERSRYGRIICGLFPIC